MCVHNNLCQKHLYLDVTREKTIRSENRAFRSLVAVGLFVASGWANAQSTLTDQFDVRITIEGTCTVLTATDIDFGTQVSAAGTHQQSGSIAVQCTNGLPFQLGLNGGESGTETARVMRGPRPATSASIPYTLSAFAFGGSNWGSVETGTAYSGSGQGLGSAFEVLIPVYAEATLVGSEPVGTYQDTVTATLSF